MKKGFISTKKIYKKENKKKGRNRVRKIMAGPEYSGERAMYNINIAGPTGRTVINVINMINDTHVIDCS